MAVFDSHFEGSTYVILSADNTELKVRRATFGADTFPQVSSHSVPDSSYPWDTGVSFCVKPDHSTRPQPNCVLSTLGGKRRLVRVGSHTDTGSDGSLEEGMGLSLPDGSSLRNRRRGNRALDPLQS